MNEYVKLSELVKVPGIGKKTLERIRETCTIYRFDGQPDKKKEELSNWLDEILKTD